LKKLKAGIIGCGQIAGGYNFICERDKSLSHACSYKNIKSVDLVAACDPNKKALHEFQQKWRVNSIYPSISEMLENEKIDILSVCSPTEFHLESFEAISHNKNIKGIFCEKPLAYDLNDAKKILSLAKEKIVSINYFRRWNPSLKKLKNDFQSKKYGTIDFVHIRYTKGLINNASHYIDLLTWFFGAPIEIETTYIYPKISFDFGVDFRLTFKDGFVASFSHCPELKFVHIEMDFFTDMGKLSLLQRGQYISWYKSEIDQSYSTFKKLSLSKSYETEWQDCPTRAIMELISRIQGKGKISCTLEDGIQNSIICKKIIDSPY